MNWSRVKTIFIVLFLCIDLFLLSTIIISTQRATRITPEIVDSTVQLLAQNGVTIDSSIIPRKIGTADYLRADNVIDDYGRFAERLLGEDCVSSGESTYSAASGSLRFTGDRFDLACTGVSGTELSPAVSAKKFLEERGFDMAHAKEEIAGGDVIFRNYKGGMPIFNSEIRVSFDGNAITGVSGSWFNAAGESGQGSRLKSATALLIDFISERKSGEPMEISALEQGYSLPDKNAYHKSAVLVPVLRIDTGEQEFFLDARNAE